MKNKMEIVQFIILTIFILLLSTGCESKEEQAAASVENYLTYLVNQDATKLSNISCSDWEEQAIMEMDSFQAVSPALEGMECKLDSANGDVYLVKCNGKIVTTYNDEAREFDLARNTYRVVSSEGELLVCGYE